MAPQTNEFGTKVALLSGLVVMCAARPVLDRVLPEPRSAADDLRRFASRLAGGGAGAGVAHGARAAGRIGLAVVAVFVLGGGHRRRRHARSRARRPDTSEALDGVPHQVDPATFPSITVDQDVADWDHTIAGRAPSRSS